MIMRDVNMGWAIRYTHANVASFFFIFVYAHIARGLYYGSYKSPRVAPWSIGVVILVLMIATAFLGLKNLAQNGVVLTDFYYFSQDINYCTIGPIVCSKRLSELLLKQGGKIKLLVVWENLTKPDIKKEIYPAIKPISGIYMIVNKISGKMYIGSATPNRMHIRFHKHLFAGSGNKPLWNAIQKYGLNNFAFLVVEEFFDFTKDKNQELLDLETIYIAAYGDYNIVEIAGNTLGFKHTEETKAAMRANYSQARRDAIGALNRGKQLSPEVIEQIRSAAIARPPKSDETKNKVSANSANAALYELTMLDGTLLTNDSQSIVLRTIPAIANYCNCGEKTVRRALKGTGIIKGKWVIKSLGSANTKP